MTQFWDLIMDIICEDSKYAKIIEIFHLGEAVSTLKFSTYTTVGSMFFWLTLNFDLQRGQIKVEQDFFANDLIQLG